MINVEEEPVYALRLGVDSVIDAQTARRWAAEDAEIYFSLMIYGWDFEYTIGDKSRGIKENFALTPRGNIARDSKFSETHIKYDDNKHTYEIWFDYNLDDAQNRRLAAWKNNKNRVIQAAGIAALGGPAEITERSGIKKAAVQDAARNAVLALLKGELRNRPKTVKGRVAVTGSFPLFGLRNGIWNCNAAFIIELSETMAQTIF